MVDAFGQIESECPLFDLVADVGKYPEFLPWCVAARIRSRNTTELLADLTIGFGPFRESFSSRVALDRPVPRPGAGPAGAL